MLLNCRLMPPTQRASNPNATFSSRIHRLSYLKRWSVLPQGPLRCYMNTHSRLSSSSGRWRSRQGTDIFTRKAKSQSLKSRAAFKLLEYSLFKKGQIVVDLGFAPGSWSQVAIERTKPGGRVIGVDLNPVQAPYGVSTIQGDFLSAKVQAEIKRMVQSVHDAQCYASGKSDMDLDKVLSSKGQFRNPTQGGLENPKIVDYVNHAQCSSGKVDVVLSDMMINTSGIGFKDHAGSMDLCMAALQFASDALCKGGHLVCKFYQGNEDKELETKLREMFAEVYREKPESSRSESKEAFFIAMRRNDNM